MKRLLSLLPKFPTIRQPSKPIARIDLIIDEDNNLHLAASGSINNIAFLLTQKALSSPGFCKALHSASHQIKLKQISDKQNDEQKRFVDECIKLINSNRN